MNSTSKKIYTPNTEGIKYAGSKLKLLPQIVALIKQTDSINVFDAFSGTTRVSQALAKTGHRVYSNDVSIWSETFARCYLCNSPSEKFVEMIEYLNTRSPVNGWFTQTYGGTLASEKKPFQIHNTQKLDAIRDEIDKIADDINERAVLLTSLILALDKVDSTMGHFASYLRGWSNRSFKTLKLCVPNLFESSHQHQVFRSNVFDIVDKIEADLTYLDPPYGSNNEKMPPSRVRYCAYYHLWTSVILNDKPETFGRANRRNDSRDTEGFSIFEEFRKNSEDKYIAVDAIERLIKRVRSRYILLSYSSGGRATRENLFEIIQDSGRIIEFIKVKYKQNVMASMRWTNDWIREKETPNQEYLFLLEKN